MSADFNFYINRQGIRGLTGPKGDQGYSPQISVIRDTADEYILLVQNENSSFETSNLRGNFIIDDTAHGSMIKYDAENNRLYTGEYRVADHTDFGTVRLATMDDIENPVEDDAVVVNVTLLNELIDTYVTQLDTKIDTVRDELTLSINNLRDELVLEMNNLISELHNDYVTLRTKQDITGTKTFGKLTPSGLDVLNDAVIVVPRNRVVFRTTEYTTGASLYESNDTFYVSSLNDIYISSGVNDTSRIELKPTVIQLTSNELWHNNHPVLTNNNVEQGDNIILERTSTGIKISATGGGGGGDVTAAGDNTFTGVNIFEGGLSAKQMFMSVKDPFSGVVTLYNVLHQGNVEQGDNVTIEQTAKGIKISATGGGSSYAQGDGILISNNQISVRVDNQTIKMVDGVLHADLSEIGDELNTLSNRMLSAENRITVNEVDITDLDERIDTLETDTSSLNSRVSTLESTIGDISSIIDNINGEVI